MFSLTKNVLYIHHRRAIIEAIVDSGVFGKSERQIALFKYLLCENYAGRSKDITATDIANHVFECDGVYDQLISSIVRGEMYTLRQNLKLFSAKSDSLRIEIPNYSYDVVVRHKSVGGVFALIWRYLQAIRSGEVDRDCQPEYINLKN